jgi:uncharacterized membrane protein
MSSTLNYPLPLAGRNAIVTGASRGLGAQIALDLAKAGANVLVVSFVLICVRYLIHLRLLRIIRLLHRLLKLKSLWNKCGRSIQLLNLERSKQMCEHNFLGS